MMRRTALSIALLGNVFAWPAAGQTQGGQPAAPHGDADWPRTVAALLGRPGTEMPGGIYCVALPRTDLHVTVDDVPIRPGFALGSWLAFREDGGQLMAMGDLVLLEREIAPVMRRLAQSGIEVTALHNRLLRAQPATMYLHVAGTSDPARLATALRDALQETKTPLTGAAGPAAVEGIDTAVFARALGREGRAAGGVYSVSVPRAEVIRERGVEVPAAMGLGTAINLQAAGNGRGAVTGDLVLTAAEVVPVQRALVEHGIEVTAVHNHMLGEEPRLFFMHFWAVDDPERLGRGLHAAIDRTNSRAAAG